MCIRDRVKPVQPENQPEKPARPEEGSFMEIMKAITSLREEIMGELKELRGKLNKTNNNITSLSKKIDDFGEEINGKLDECSKARKEQMAEINRKWSDKETENKEDTNTTLPAVSYTHLDVYKRQVLHHLQFFFCIYYSLFV